MSSSFIVAHPGSFFEMPDWDTAKQRARFFANQGHKRPTAVYEIREVARLFPDPSTPAPPLKLG